jgi:Type II secretion system (T2SS), protein M subtype b
MKLWMRASSRTNALLLTVCLLMGFLCLSAFLDRRAELIEQRDVSQHACDEAQSIMQKQTELQHFLAGPGATMTSDSAAIERRLLHLVHDWEQQTGVQEASFQRSAAVADHGFTRLAFEVSADGSLAAVAALLYRVEVSPFPLRVDSAQIHRTTGGENVEIHLTLSALCRRGTTAAENL